MQIKAPSRPIATAVQIPSGAMRLEGDLEVPEGALGLVVFAHGSGSGRHSPRNRSVARALRQASIGTLLMDLLTLGEERDDFDTAAFRFDIRLLASRVADAWSWVTSDAGLSALPIGLFGASTGAAAALVAAAQIGAGVRAIVSRGGRPDLAGEALGAVRSPTLLIVGARDETVLRLNELALAQLRGEKRLAVVPGATHLFEETGALEQVSRLAADWFARHFA